MAADTSAGRAVPPGSVPTGSPLPNGERLTIGKVLGLLGEEFPDVSASKIRFLEAEGLVTPERTPSGYRTYSAADVARLRYILAAQRDRYWPLKVIREALDALDRGLDDAGAEGGQPKPPAPSVDPHVPSAAELTRRRDIALTGPELREATGLDRSTFHALEGFGLIQPRPDGHYGEESLAVAAAAVALAEHGLEPRHLRPFRTAADREIGLVEQLLATRRGDGSRDERAAEVLSACIALHVALVRAGLAR
ncbi:MerR family transcriptional regulator [Intrasporangium oryzae NRRL B-24470]|uniref:MerR family transcriptional regulator n=1 Tax=Intrasporangium oryzae NRRL B-24470 TaxID=1386089 RepID=W9G1Y6_9MICO|nr:MerR family transcriptional regulator [Intrasporangium oryzae]EWT00096.1 MerR family transcriptional regulator [Intrasporangium oryzae NRRL B-24470]